MDTPSPTDLEAVQEAREETERQEAKRREHRRNDFLWVMNDARGRGFVWRLMGEAGVFKDFASSEGTDMARFLGERRQGLQLLNDILQECPEHWLSMIKEQAKR